MSCLVLYNKDQLHVVFGHRTCLYAAQGMKLPKGFPAEMDFNHLIFLISSFNLFMEICEFDQSMDDDDGNDLVSSNLWLLLPSDGVLQ